MTRAAAVFGQFPACAWLCLCLGLAGAACAVAALVILRRNPGVVETPRALSMASFCCGVVAPAALGLLWTQSEFRQAVAAVPLIAPRAVGEALQFTYGVTLNAVFFGAVVAAAVLPLALGTLVASFARGGAPLPVAAAALAVSVALAAAGWHLGAKAARLVGVPLDLGAVHARCLGPIFDRLPLSPRAHPFDHKGQFLVVESDRVLLDWKPVVKLENGRVRAADKEGGRGDSYLVVPLLEAFKRRAAELKRPARKGAPMTADRLSYAAEVSVPERTLAEIFYTAGQAGIGLYLKAVRIADDPGRLYLEYAPE